ncbi:MAG: hypothetical protein WC887_00295 [Candidatus Paceibacterota bacterium]|jgi:hypothetical protein
MKKIFFISVFFLFFGLAPHVFAACSDYSNFTPIQRTTGQGCVEILGPGWVIVDTTCLGTALPSDKNTVCGSTAQAAPANPTPNSPTGQTQPSATPTGNNNASQGFTALAPIPGLTDTNGAVVNSKSLSDFFNNLYKYLIGIAAILAVIQIIRAGFDIATNKDNVSVLMSSKSKISQAIYGLVLVLSPVLVFSIINPSILNLSLNLPPLNTAPETQVGNGGNSTGVTATDTTTGCTTSGTNGILQIATCPSNDAVEKEIDRCGSNSGKISIISKNSLTNGTIVSAMLMCKWSNKYVFIDTRDQGIIGWLTSQFNTINDIQPLAITTDNPNNGNSAIQFMETCSNSGLSTCISATAFTNPVDCTPTPKTPLPGKARKCGNLTLTCRDYGTIHTFVGSLCSKSPSWTPFQ